MIIYIAFLLLSINYSNLHADTNLVVSPTIHREIKELKKNPTRFAQNYHTFVNQLITLNDKIKPHTSIKKNNALRVMSFNVHKFSDAKRKPTATQMLEIFYTTNPDVLVFQEAELENPVVLELKKRGYIHTVFGGIDSKSSFGNLLLSRYPLKRNSVHYFKSNDDIKMGRTRSFIKAELDLSAFNKKNLVIYGTHLAIYTQVPGYTKANIEPDNQIRLLEVKEIVAMIQKENAQKNVLLAGDFNHDYSSTVEQYLNDHNFKDCFETRGISHFFTSIYGHIVDFIKTKFIDLYASGCYVYFTTASDHLPLIMDVELK